MGDDYGNGSLTALPIIETQEGDVFEILAAPFTLPVRNELKRAAPVQVAVKTL